MTRLKTWACWGLAIWVIHGVLAGPVLMLAQRRVIPTSWLEVYISPFSPLGITMNFVPGAEGVIQGYLMLWAQKETHSK